MTDERMVIAGVDSDRLVAATSSAAGTVEVAARSALDALELELGVGAQVLGVCVAQAVVRLGAERTRIALGALVELAANQGR